jgi:cytochrome bd-type quinol oxidase subunit 2
LPAIRVAPLGVLRVYPIYEEELNQFAQGSPVQLCLNFALALLASGLSFLANLLATDIASIKTFNVFVILTALFLLVGTVLLTVWWKLHRSTKNLAQRIRDRMPPPPGTLET